MTSQANARARALVQGINQEFARLFRNNADNSRKQLPNMVTQNIKQSQYMRLCGNICGYDVTEPQEKLAADSTNLQNF